MKKKIMIGGAVLAAFLATAWMVYTAYKPVRAAESDDKYWKCWIVKQPGDSCAGYLVYQGNAEVSDEIRVECCGDTGCRFISLVPDTEKLGTLQAAVLGSRSRIRYSVAASPPGVPDAQLYTIEWTQNGERMRDRLEW